MRFIPLDQPKARYERIKLIDQAETYGQELDPHATAPFTVRWNAPTRSPGVFIDDTCVAHVSFDQKTPMLRVREGCPEKFDFALLRALRNTMDVTDTIGKMQRAEAREKKGDEGLFTRTTTAFRPEIQDADDMHKALLGLETLDKRIGCHVFTNKAHIPDQFYITASFGRQGHAFNVYIRPDGLVSDDANSAYGFRESSLNAALREGLSIFNERMIPARLEEACRALISSSAPIDETSLQAEYGATPLDKRNQTVITRSGGLSSVQKFRSTWHRFQGIRFAQGINFEGTDLPPSFAVDKDLIKRAGTIMNLRWQAATLGKDIKDYPLLTEDLLESRMADIDFGYDG